jgi:hypothetical protein
MLSWTKIPQKAWTLLFSLPMLCCIFFPGVGDRTSRQRAAAHPLSRAVPPLVALLAAAPLALYLRLTAAPASQRPRRSSASALHRGTHTELFRPPSLCSRVLCCAVEAQGVAYRSPEQRRICAHRLVLALLVRWPCLASPGVSDQG